MEVKMELALKRTPVTSLLETSLLDPPPQVVSTASAYPVETSQSRHMVSEASKKEARKYSKRLGGIAKLFGIKLETEVHSHDLTHTVTLT